MKICSYKGLSLVIMLRDEHCPPHVHVDGGAWGARFVFSFWHNGVELLDVTPLSRRPPLAVLEGLRQTLKQAAHLRRARCVWWVKLHTTCLRNQLWDSQANEIVLINRNPKMIRRIASARYDLKGNTTLMELVGACEGVEIEL
ncbi:DUF4160 domain-containing protein [Pseudomonas sp. P5_152]|uniref:DUF4160 domain-containing protein n=1 Tax=Pseudomonas sp. P5_152 TaxID=3043442 RepID=UPI002A37210D|nr:DUF4160 domain-containing protein [Pseudomonas sp. P5_152]MDX9665367.1 DUF4160 domain-containing protein [Pseudomonas sp. P5_152]